LEELRKILKGHLRTVAVAAAAVVVVVESIAVVVIASSSCYDASSPKTEVETVAVADADR